MKNVITLTLVILAGFVTDLSAQNPLTQPAKPNTPQPAPTTVVVIPQPVAPPTPSADGSVPSAAEQPAPTPIVIHSPPAPLTDRQKDALLEQKEIVSRFANPNDLIDYFLEKVWWGQTENAFACIEFGSDDLSEKSKRTVLFQLRVVLARLEERDIYDFPTAESVMQQHFQSPAGPIELEFVRGKVNNWMFSKKTVEYLDQYFNLLKNEPPIRLSRLMHFVPGWAFQPIFGMPSYRIIFVLTAFFLGFVLKFLIEWVLYRLTRWFFNLVLSDWDRNKVNRRTWQPIGLVVLFSFWFLGLILIVQSFESLDFLHSLYVTFVVVMVVWMSFRIVDLFSLWLRQKMHHRDPNIDIIFFPMFSRTTKLLVICFGFLALASAFSWSVVGLVSGLGIGGIAVAFAAKETIANLFGSVTVLADRPFVIGDWIKTGDIEGTVESVGMRSTRIRTFYNSLVTIPNNNLTTAVIDNMGARYYRRFRTFLSIPLDTEPERIEAFCEGIRELIRRHPYTRKDLFHVYLHEFKPYALDILLNVFFVCPDTSIEFRERGRLIADILRLAKELDIRFALPTQVQHNIESQPTELKFLGDDPISTGRGAAVNIYPLDD